MLNLFNIFQETLSIFYSLGFKRIPLPDEFCEFPFTSKKEIDELYNNIRNNDKFDFPYKYVSFYNFDYKTVVFDSDLAEEYSLKLAGISKQSVFEVSVLRSLFHWLIHRLPDENGDVCDYDKLEELHIVQQQNHQILIQLFTWHSIKHDKHFLETFDIINSKHSDTYANNIFEFLKYRSLSDIINDFIYLRKLKDITAFDWSDLISDKEMNELINKALMNPNINFRKLEAFISKERLERLGIDDASLMKEMGMFDS